MGNIIKSTTDLALHIAREYIRPGGVIVDATCGNGHDTLALAEAARSIAEAAREISATGAANSDICSDSTIKLFAFDIQQDAINATGRLLMSEGFINELSDGSIRLICDSHAKMDQYLTAGTGANQPASADLIVFNLGYLPGGDKTITTKADSTVAAIRTGLSLLARDGALCITMYSGHPEGAKEKAQLLDYARNLDSREFHVSYISMVNQINNPPEILIISRKL